MIIFTCDKCDYRNSVCDKYLSHYELVHINGPKSLYSCGVRACTRKFSNRSSFYSHLYRDHVERKENLRKTSTASSEFLIKNTARHDQVHLCCETQFSSIHTYICHLKEHIKGGNSVQCPYDSCSNKYSVLSSFSSHISRHHKSHDVVPPDTSVTLDPVLLVKQNEPFLPSSSSYDNYELYSPGFATHNIESDFNNFQSIQSNNTDSLLEQEFTSQDAIKKSLLHLYINLESNYHIPDSTLQVVVEKYRHALDGCMDILKEKLRKQCAMKGVDEDDVKYIISNSFNDEPLRAMHQPKGDLGSRTRRHAAFKEYFMFVEPVSISLGLNDNYIDCHYHYVPIAKNLQALLTDESVKIQYDDSKLRDVCPESGLNTMYTDVYDGSYMKNHALFSKGKTAISLLVYQDAFEINNPLGSGKKKHKLVAFYYTLGNMYPWCRSQVNAMQFALLVKEKDLKYFGQKFVYTRLISDLKKLETQGLSVNGRVVKVAVALMLGESV